MSLVKSNKRQSPMWGKSLFSDDPFFADLMDPRRGMMKLNRMFNPDDFDFSPAVNIRDKKKEYEIELAAPGLKKEDFDISIDDGILNISAEAKSEKETKEDDFVKREFSYNSFSRAMSLPESIDEDKEVKAIYKDGILKMTLQKKENGDQQKKHKTIKVS